MIEKQFGEYAIDLVARLEGNLKKAAQEVNTGSWLRSVATNERQKALTESLGRVVGWFSIIFNPPKQI